MRRIRERLHLVAEGDQGMTLMEVMVAMLVFLILSTLVLSSLLQIVGQTQHSRAQHAAANLAAAEIELAHDTPDIFALLDESRDTTVNGTVFHIRRETAWVSEAVSAAPCGAGGGSLRYKRVHVTVTWDGMRDGASPVRADTLLNPVERINDPSKGTVLVSIFDSIGEGVPGAEVRLTATSGGASIPARSTDAQGCAYFLQVPGGTYDVTVGKTGYTGVLEETPRQRDVSVQAGSSTSIAFQYDLAARLNVTLAGGGSVRLPSSMPMTLLSTYGVRTVTLPSRSTSQSIAAHPRVSYRVFAGEFQQDSGEECAAFDPTAWPEALVDGEQLGAGGAPDLSAEPGGAISADIPMGLVRIGSGTSSLRATTTTGRPEDPLCETTIQLSFGSVSTGDIVAVPFGSWRFHTSGGSAVPATGVSRGADLSSNVVTLDPREPAP